MSRLQIPTAKVFQPFLQPSRYKAAYGGRGSGKSHNFADNLIDRAICQPGLRAVCIREVQKSLKESAKRLIEDKIELHGVTGAFDCQKEATITPGGGIIIYQGMQDHTAESIKSLEGFDIAWVEEAQTLSNRSLQLLRPTIRKAGSEIWASWNPRFKTDPIDQLFRSETPPTDSIVIKANWSDNPWFPEVLEQERLDCFNNNPEVYDHIWEGGYVTFNEGAYYAKCLAEAKQQGRLTSIPIDPLLTVRLFCDIGGTGARADAFVIWAAQFIGREVFCIDYYEAQGQPLEAHLAWLRERGYTPDKAQFWLPHDGANHDKVYSVSYETALQDAGYEVTIVPNQGKGAASARVEAGRRLFPAIWIDDSKCQGGIDALGWYHERKDENRNIGLGPEHDWSSHAADAFGLMCVAYEPPGKISKPIDFTGWNG